MLEIYFLHSSIFFQNRSSNYAQEKVLHLFSRGLGGREGQLMAEIFIFCFPTFFSNMSGIQVESASAVAPNSRNTENGRTMFTEIYVSVIK